MNNNNSRKIPKHLGNIIDNFFYDIGDIILPYIKILNITPNGLTAISLFLGILCVFYITKHRFILSSFLWLLSYFFDCLDGAMARKYNIVSEVGDKFDHYSDYLKGILLAFALIKFNTLPFNVLLVLIIVLVIVFIISNIQQAAKENYYCKKNKKKMFDTLTWTQKFNISDDYELTLKKTRWFGYGTFSTYLALFILYNEFYK